MLCELSIIRLKRGRLTHNSLRTQKLQPPFYLPLKVRMFWIIRFHPSHRLFSRPINHPKVYANYSSWLLGIYWCLFRAISLIASPVVNKNKGVAETAPLRFNVYTTVILHYNSISLNLNTYYPILGFHETSFDHKISNFSQVTNLWFSSHNFGDVAAIQKFKYFQN